MHHQPLRFQNGGDELLTLEQRICLFAAEAMKTKEE